MRSFPRRRWSSFPVVKERACRWLVPLTVSAALLAALAPWAATATPVVEATSEVGRALIRAASMETVEVAPAATRLALGTESVRDQSIATDQRIVFRLPAAYVSEAGVYAPYQARGWLFLRYWSRTFDPVAPDEQADLFSCIEGQLAPCRSPDPEDGRIAARRRGGEYPVSAWVTDEVGSEAHRRYALAYAAGSAGLSGRRGGGREPCEARWDEALGMVVSRPPEGRPPFAACNLAPYPATRNGRTRTPATFLKLEADGASRFAVSCPDHGADAEPDRSYGRCRLLGFLGLWPVVMYVRNDRAAEWENTFGGLRDFLARHAVSQSD